MVRRVCSRSHGQLLHLIQGERQPPAHQKYLRHEKKIMPLDCSSEGLRWQLRPLALPPTLTASKAGLTSGTCDPGYPTGPHTEKGPALGLMLFCPSFEVLNHL